MNQFRAGHTATLLADGTVLLVDGGVTDIDVLLVPNPSAEVFDPSQGRFSLVEQPCVAREFHTATLLKNGKVLIAGGSQGSWVIPTPTADLYDPASRSFASTGAMAFGRSQHTATLLPDGRVLLTGGSTPTDGYISTPTASTEIYDPAAGSFAAAANMSTARGGHTATMLPSGKVLITGGHDGATALASAELYDPATNEFSPTGSMSVPRNGHTATLLPNGRVLVAGGISSATPFPGVLPFVASLASAEVYDPATGTFSPTGPMTTGRVAHTATLFLNGEILITGGSSGGYAALSAAELYNPDEGTFRHTDAMNELRFWHAATALSDGAVLINRRR